jgi:hypothetical protein
MVLQKMIILAARLATAARGSPPTAADRSNVQISNTDRSRV